MTEKTHAPYPEPDADAGRLKAEAAQLIRQGRTQEAANLLEQAAAMRPDDAELALLLGSALYHLGDYATSLEKLTRAAALAPQRHDAHLLLARSAIKAGDAPRAFAALDAARRLRPEDERAYALAAALATEERDWPFLVRMARLWTEAIPASPEGWSQLARGYLEDSAFSPALEAAARAADLAPTDLSRLVAAARIALAGQRYDAARGYLDRARALAPESSDVLFAQARLHHLLGELAQAETACRRVIAAAPAYAPAYAELSALREGALSDAEMAAVERLLADKTLHADYRAMLCFALADALDKQGAPEKAMAHYEAGNAVNLEIAARENLAYDAQAQEENIRLLKDVFSVPIKIDAGALGPASVRPIFIVAMPRSGTTLLESIIAAHSKAHGAGELPMLPRLHRELMDCAREKGANSARALLKSSAPAWRARYFEALPPFGDAEAVVDKQPINFQSLGLIRALFPEAVILHIERAPIDCGFSIYRHNFSKNWPCAHRLSDIAHYYALYRRIVEFWRNAGAAPDLDLRHETLARAPEREVPRILEACRLPFEEACLSPHAQQRPIATFSGVQARQPISARYASRYEAYAPLLATLDAALKSEGVEPRFAD
ncbi:MAG TPA: sulfotransferase [Parvularculaceae bacterium]|nr:sulfotransferase [Parvularculaceae bacterium]